MSGENSFRNTFIAPPPVAVKTSAAKRFASSPALLLFLAGLIIGAVIVGWRAKARFDQEKSAARIQTAAKAAMLEAQFSQAISAAEVLLTLNRQAGGPIPNFQKVAADLRRSRPLIASIELQPGGVTTDVVPRIGNERLLGLNTLTHPAHQRSARAALSGRDLVVDAPLPLPAGNRGLIVRGPIIQKGRDGRETYWGLISVTLRLPDVMGRVGLADLSKAGYDYALFVPGPARQQVTTLALQGRPSLSRAVQFPVQVGNLKATLAVERHGGWFDASKLLLECLVMLLVAAGLGLLYNLFESRRAAEQAFAEAQRRSERETADRAKAQEETRTTQDLLAAAQADLKRTLSRLQQAETALADLPAFQQQLLDQQNQAETAQTRLQQAEVAASDLRQRLEKAERNAENARAEKERELDKAEAAQQKLQARVAELQKKVEESSRSAVEFACQSQTELQEARNTIADLKSRLETVSLETLEAEEKFSVRMKMHDTEIRTLKAELDAARKTAIKADPPQTPAEEQVPEEIAPALDEPAPQDRVEEPEPAPEPPKPEEQAIISPDPSVAAEPEIIAAVPSAQQAAPKPARRKKTKRDNQMDLFTAPQAPAAPAESASEDASEPAETTPFPESESITEIESPEPEEEPEERPVVEAATEAQLAGEEEEEAPEESAPLPDFPEIEGLAVNEGLAWADNDVSAYWKALRQFSDRQAAAAENIRAALEAGNLADADRAVQSLKTASGDIAAIQLHAAAGALARAIHDQSDPAELESLWESVESRLSALLSELRRVLKPKEEKTTHRAHTPPVNPAELRKAASLIVPLLVDGDPGAKDCLKDNRSTFRSAFSPDAYQDFEQCVRKGDFGPALESLKKAAKKHGIGL